MKKQPWDDNLVQFARLLAEIHAAGLDDETMAVLCESMDLEKNDVVSLFERAESCWEEAKASAKRDRKEG